MSETTEHIFRKYESLFDEELSREFERLSELGFQVKLLCIRDLEHLVGSFTPRLEWGFQIQKSLEVGVAKVHLLFLEPDLLSDPLFFLGRASIYNQSGELTHQNQIGGLVKEVLDKGMADYALEQFEKCRLAAQVL